MAEVSLMRPQSGQFYEVDRELVLAELATRINEVPAHPWSEDHQKYLEDFDSGVVAAIASIEQPVSINWVLLSYLRLSQLPKTRLEAIQKKLGGLTKAKFLIEQDDGSYVANYDVIEVKEQPLAQIIQYPGAKSTNSRAGDLAQGAEDVDETDNALPDDEASEAINGLEVDDLEDVLDVDLDELGEQLGLSDSEVLDLPNAKAKPPKVADGKDISPWDDGEKHKLEHLQLPAEPESRRIAQAVRDYILGKSSTISLSAEDLKDAGSVYLGCRIAMRDDSYGDTSYRFRLQEVTDMLHENSRTSENLDDASIFAIKLSHTHDDVRANGKCRNLNVGEFISDTGGGTTAVAKEACRNCKVREGCLEVAIQNVDLVGYWGGTSERERRKIRKDRKAAGEKFIRPPRLRGKKSDPKAKSV